MSDEDTQIFFEWKNKTNQLIEENITIPSENNDRITPLEYLINTVIQKLNENE